MSKKNENNKNKKNVAGTYNVSKDETSGSSGRSFWDKLLEVIYKNGGGR